MGENDKEPGEDGRGFRAWSEGWKNTEVDLGGSTLSTSFQQGGAGDPQEAGEKEVCTSPLMGTKSKGVLRVNGTEVLLQAGACAAFS